MTDFRFSKDSSVPLNVGLAASAVGGPGLREPRESAAIRSPLSAILPPHSNRTNRRKTGTKEGVQGNQDKKRNQLEIFFNPPSPSEQLDRVRVDASPSDSRQFFSHLYSEKPRLLLQDWLAVPPRLGQ